jgi:hypothetical protein
MQIVTVDSIILRLFCGAILALCLVITALGGKLSVKD